MQDLNDKITGSTLTAVEWNEVPSEIQNVITDLGISLSSGDLNQLGKAIAGYVGNGTFYTDSGAVDAYVLSTIGSKQSPPSYTDGMRVVFRPGNTNTGASTVNVNAIGVKNIKLSDGTDPVAGQIDTLTELIFDSANDRFQIIDQVSQTQLPTSWVVFDGTGTPSISASFNVSSITDLGIGQYTLNFANNLNNADFAPFSNVSNSTATGQISGADTPTVSGFRVITRRSDTGATVDVSFNTAFTIGGN